MTNWIVDNKDWFLSGAGIFIISGFFSFLSVVMTLLIKGRNEKKKRRRLQLSEKLIKFEIPNAGKSIDSGLLLVSYKGTDYNHLCHYSVYIANTGSCAIENQNLLFSFSKDAIVLESFEEASSSLIKVSSETICDTNETLYHIDRLEHGESLTISILVNTEDLDSIKCTPRGVDNIDYMRGKPTSKNDIEILVLFIAIFIFVDNVPYINNVFQALVVLASTPIIVKLARTFINNSKSKENSVTIMGGIKASEDGVVHIHQSSSTPNAND